MNVRVLGKGLELLSVNGGRLEINQLFADDTALVVVVVVVVVKTLWPISSN